MRCWEKNAYLCIRKVYIDNDKEKETPTYI